MILGVFMHASLVYALDDSWVVHAPQTGLIYSLIAVSLKFFRNDTFFLISGFFALMIYQRYGTHGFFRRNLVRVGIPTLFVGFCLNLPQSLLMSVAPPMFVKKTEISWYGIVDGSIWVYHLWFLLSLFAMFLLFPFAYQIVTGLLRFFKQLPLLRELPPLLPTFYISTVIVGVSLVYLAMLLVAKYVPEIYNELLFFESPFRLTRVAIFFTIGVLMFRYPELLERFYRDGYQIAGAALLMHFLSGFVDHQSLAGKITTNLFHILAVLAVAQVFLLMFRTFFNHQSAFWSYMSGASYTIYLLHHVVVIVLALGLMPLAIPIAVKYAILCVAGLGVSLLVHEYVVLRSSTARLLLNGRLDILEAPRSAPGEAPGIPALKGQ